LLDCFSAAALSVVCLVGIGVYLFCLDYMAADSFCSRFSALLLIFTFLMLVYLTADNLLLAFIGWEGIGVASFLLINFWSSRVGAAISAVKAMV
jgi:NADH:ubiquinone oxidoreductase subunit 5 (subunit L)/multisubunit Na+/H+ antiporter MnhA subunit